MRTGHRGKPSSPYTMGHSFLAIYCFYRSYCNNSMKPSELEMQILSVLWSRGPSTAREVLESMPDKKQRAYTSILSVLQAMDRKGLVGREREGLTDRWRATMKKEEILRPYFGDLVRKIFGGKPSAAFLHLLESNPVDDAEMREIENLIAEHKRKKRS